MNRVTYRRWNALWLAPLLACGLLVGCERGGLPLAPESANAPSVQAAAPAVWNPMVPLDVYGEPALIVSTPNLSPPASPLADEFRRLSTLEGEDRGQVTPLLGVRTNSLLGVRPQPSAAGPLLVPSPPASEPNGAAAATPASPAAAFLPAPEANLDLSAVRQQAANHYQQGYVLARRGACFAARAEFIQALRVLAQGLDAAESTQTHGQALAAGTRALREAEDFVPRGARLEADLDLATLVRSHRTPVMHAVRPEQLTAAACVQRYHAYAAEQLALAAGGDSAGSQALHGLGKLHDLLASQGNPLLKNGETKAIAYHQAALLVQPNNYLAANELGVLLARAGNYSESCRVLQHGVSVSREPSIYHNLAVVHARLGQTAAAETARRAARTAGATTARLDNPAVATLQSVRWLDPKSFAATSTPGTDIPKSAAATPAAPALLPTPAPAAREARRPATASRTWSN